MLRALYVGMSASRPAAIRYALAGLLAFGALNAFAGGWYGLAGAEGVPPQWLDGSPFRSYVVPSLILLTVVGGSLFIAAIAVFARLRGGRLAAIGAGAIVLGWLTAQVAIIGYVSWMQPATAVAGLMVLVLARVLPKAETLPRQHGTPRAQRQNARQRLTGD